MVRAVPGVHTGPGEEPVGKGNSYDCCCAIISSAVTRADAARGPGDPGVRRVPWLAAAVEPRAARRWSSGAGAAWPRHQRHLDPAAARVSEAAGLCGQRLGPWPQLRSACPASQDGMLALLRELNETHGRKVSVVGWSLGGVYARQLAKMEPDRVRSVITLGSPFGGQPTATNAWRIYEMVSGKRAATPTRHFGGADAPIRRRCRRRRSSAAPMASAPGRFAWSSGRRRTENIEVQGSHCGLGHNPAVVYAIADSPGAGRRQMEAVPSLAAGAASSTPTRIGEGSAQAELLGEADALQLAGGALRDLLAGTRSCAAP